jgi:NADH-quinone oxidoreductase subunit N
MQALAMPFGALGPAAVLAMGAVAVLLAEVLFLRRSSILSPSSGVERRAQLLLAAVASVAILVAIGAALGGVADSAAASAGSPDSELRLDGLAAVSIALICFGGLLCLWLSTTYLTVLRIEHGGYYALLLLSMAGSAVVLAAENLMVLWVGFELAANPTHALVGFDRKRRRSTEAGLKSFITSAFASAILVYGIALLYGATGQLDYAALRAGLVADDGLAMTGLGLVLVGFAWKAALVPFHQWAPDAWEGAPTPVTAFLSVAATATALLTLLRVVDHALADLGELLRPLFWALSAASIVLGAAMSIIQQSVKRMLAWASVAHAGYAAMALVAATGSARVAMIFYLFVYVLMHVGAFGVVVTLAAGGREVEQIDDFAGLSRTRPGLAAALTLFLLALAGIPGTAGFFARLEIFTATIGAGELGLVAVGVLGSVVSLYAYLRLPIAMYMRDTRRQGRGQATMSELLVIGICAIAVVWLGLLPNAQLPGLGAGLLDWIASAVG